MPIEARITYALSHKGQCDSLRRAGDGRRIQVVTGPVNDDELNAFALSDEGDVYFDMTGDWPPISITLPDNCGWVKKKRDDSSFSEIEIQWDAVPTWADLVAVVRAHDAAWREIDEENRRSEERLEQVARAFLSDPNARAERLDGGWATLSGETFLKDHPVAIEARRRAAQDQEQLKQANRATLADWIARHGTENQRQRMLAGLLPWQEAYSTAEDHLFVPLSNIALYKRWEPEEVHCECLGTTGIRCTPKFQSVDATELSADEWDQFTKIETVVPGAQFQFREHRAKCELAFAPEVRRGVIVKFTMGKLTFKREFAL